MKAYCTTCKCPLMLLKDDSGVPIRRKVCARCYAEQKKRPAYRAPRPETDSTQNVDSMAQFMRGSR